MSLEDIAVINITTATVSPTRQGFGRAMVAGLHTRFAERARLYSTTAAMLADGFLTTDEEYQIVSTMFSQSPRPVDALVGRRDAADATMAASLDAINLYNSDWYGLVLDTTVAASNTAAAAWAEANGKLFAAQTADVAAYDPASTTDIAYTLKNSNLGRTELAYHPTAGQWLAAGALAVELVREPGSYTMAYKTVRGVTAYALTATQRAALLAKNVTIYTTVAGVSVTEGAKVVGGEWVDVVRFLDQKRARMAERFFALLVNNDKLPYTDAGVELVKGEVLAELKDGVRVGGFDGDSPLVVTAPKVADIDATTRGTRRLPSVAFSARLAGAIHLLTASGTVTA